MDYEKALELALETPENAEEEVKEGKFVVDDLDKLEWAAKKIAQKKAEQNKIVALIDARIKKLIEWRDEQLKPLADDISYLEYLTRDFAMAEIAKQKKKKSYTAPNGAKFSVKHNNDELTAPDKKKLLEYLEKNKYNDYIENTPAPKWGEFKAACKVVDGKAISPDGEVIDFIPVKPAGDTYTVDVKGVDVE